MTTNELTTVLTKVLQDQSKPGFGVNEVVAVVSALIGIFALIVARCARKDSAASAREAQITNELNRAIARRQGVLELHAVWLNIARIDSQNPVAVDVWNAEKALQTTASLWNHDILDKNLILLACWADFKELYESILHCEQPIPGDGRKCNELITPEIQQAYEAMEINVARIGRSSLSRQGI